MNQIVFLFGTKHISPTKRKINAQVQKRTGFCFIFFKFCDSFNDLDMESDTQTWK